MRDSNNPIKQEALVLPRRLRDKLCLTDNLHGPKVTHHGSNTSSTPLFLNSFTPEIAVIQVGADNSYGHPTPQTLERLQKTGAQVFRNDEHGDVIVIIDGEKADVAVTKEA